MVSNVRGGGAGELESSVGRLGNLLETVEELCAGPLRELDEQG